MSERTARTKKEIVNDILWNNNEVTIGGKSVFYKQWYDAGVKTLPDIPDKEGKFMTFTAFKEKYKIKTCYFRFANKFSHKKHFFVVNLLHLKELYLEHFINIDDVVATSVLSCLLTYKLWKLLV